jgi:hypothetical protein
VIEPLQSAIAEEMRQPIGARVKFAVGHGLAAVRHDEGGLQRAQPNMLAGVHRCSNPVV